MIFPPRVQARCCASGLNLEARQGPLRAASRAGARRARSLGRWRVWGAALVAFPQADQNACLDHWFQRVAWQVLADAARAVQANRAIDSATDSGRSATKT